jgi:hypothetical protein
MRSSGKVLSIGDVRVADDLTVQGISFAIDSPSAERAAAAFT